MNKNQSLILKTLQSDNISSREIARITGISQATISRALQNLPVIKLGRARASVFAAVLPDQAWPLYKADQTGNILKLGTLYRQPADRTLLQLDSGEHFAFDGLPYFLYDALPSGFLGAIRLKNITQQDSTLSTNSRDWTDHQALHYLTHYGDDLPGHFILGSAIAQKAANTQHPRLARSDYARLVQDIHSHPESMGSSIAGEQPKFTVYNGIQHLIVKYSPPLAETNQVAQRHRDLMICEHLALQSLHRADIAASHSELFFDDRIYLEITRFDRHGEHGREGIISLKSLDAQFAGKGTDWPRVTKSLLIEQRIKPEDYSLIETAYAFGQLIANSDMHLGNFSFFSDDLHILNPSPIYDMLPMAFMPRQGELINPDFQIPRFIDVSEPAKHQAKIAALDFWQRVIDHAQISQDFKTRVTPIYQELEADLYLHENADALGAKAHAEFKEIEQVAEGLKN